MHRYIHCFATALLCGQAFADPIHGRADGSYWHHDSGWVFPEKTGEFTLVGVPQDLAGSRDAVAWYARVANGVRTVASVDLIAPDSAAEDASLEAAQRVLEDALPADSTRVADDGAPTSGAGLPRGITRVAYLATRDGEKQLVALYHVVAGEWRVRIRLTAPRATAGMLERFDAFVRDQRWDTFASCEASMASSASCAASAGAASSP